MRKLSILALVAMMSTKVFAVTEFNKTLTRIGNQTGNLAYLYVSPAPGQNCKFDVLYLNISTTFGKTSYATMLAAKIENRPISRVDYKKQADKRCFISLIELQ